MRLFIIALIAITSCSAWAEKAGFYIGAGITSNNFISPDDDDFQDGFEDERTTGWRVEGGYIWDMGKPGGFHMGVAGTYDDFGKAEGQIRLYDAYGSEYIPANFEASALSVLFVIEQEIASWVDFVFKIGPSFVDYDLEATRSVYFPPILGGGFAFEESYSNSGSELGGTMALGFTFFPTDYLAIELARQGTAFVSSDSDSDNNGYGAGTWSASLQYRF